jgi:hypothetical protein
MPLPGTPGAHALRDLDRRRRNGAVDLDGEPRLGDAERPTQEALGV